MKYGGERLEFTLGSQGEPNGKILNALDSIAKESGKLESGKVVMFSVGWKCMSVDTRWKIYVNGEEACYKICRVGVMYYGTMNGDEEPMGCLDMRSHVKEKLRRAQKGDVRKSIYSIE